MGTWRDQGGAQQGQGGMGGPTMGAGQGMPQSQWGMPPAPPAGTGGFKPTPTPGATPPITAQGHTMGYAQGSSPAMGNAGIVPPGAPRMPTMPGMTPGIFGSRGGGGLNNPGSRMVNPQSTNGTGAGPGSSAPRMSIADIAAGGMANGWDAASGTPGGSFSQMLLDSGNPQAAKAAMTPEQWAAFQKYAQGQVAQANSNYGAGMADGTFGQGSLALQRDGTLNAYKGWL